MEVTGSETVEHLLAGKGTTTDGGVLTSLLVLIREKLTKEQWREYPVYKQALVWCIKQLKVKKATLPYTISGNPGTQYDAA